MTYTPQPGTIPHRVIAHLRSIKELGLPQPSTVELCDALGVDSQGFTAYMRPAREHGLVHTSKNAMLERVLYWRLGDGTPDPNIMRRALDSGTFSPPVDDSPAAKPVGEVLPGVPANAPLHPTFRALMWEGQLLATGMDIIDGVAVFTPDQIDQVKRVVTWARQEVAA